MTPQLRAKIRTRNHLHRTIHQNRQEWIDACREATEAINEANQKAGKTFSRTRWQISTVQTCGKLFKAFTVLLMLTLLTRLCPTTVKLSLISNRKLMYSLTTMLGSANSACHNPTVTSTDSSRNVFTHHLLTMKAVFHF